MSFDIVPLAVIVLASALLFVNCCVHIARASFARDTSRAAVLSALYGTLAFVAGVIGCLALSDAQGDVASAWYAALLCAVALPLGLVLKRSWRAGEDAERAHMAELRALVDRYRTDEDSVASRCARAARERDLTRREEEILALLLEGRTRSEIARELYVSADTVKTHIRNLYRKMGVADKDELVQTLAPSV